MSHLIRGLILIAGMSCLMLADDAVKQRVQVTNTQHLDLSASGTVTINNSAGELTIEGWDQPGVEITTVKSTKAEYTATERDKGSPDLEKVKIAAERHGDEIVITTTAPKHRRFPLRANNVDLVYHIKVPRAARLVVKHDSGEVHFDDVTGDIRATARQGDITLHLPEGQYAIDAKSDIGSVVSDFPGSTQRRWLVGHQFVQAAQAPRKLYLRIRFGDIIVLKIQQPAAPALNK